MITLHIYGSWVFKTSTAYAMRAIFMLSCPQLLLLVVTRSGELSHECHVTKHKTLARSIFPLSNFENSAPKNLKKGHTLVPITNLKRISTTLAPILSKFNNKFISTGIFPKVLKAAIVSPVYKKNILRNLIITDQFLHFQSLVKILKNLSIYAFIVFCVQKCTLWEAVWI